MATLQVFEQRPPRITALQYDGSDEAAAWIVEKFGGGAEVRDGHLYVGPPGMQDEIVEGDWVALDAAGQVTGRWNDAVMQAGWDYVEDAPADQQPRAAAPGTEPTPDTADTTGEEPS